LAEAQRIVPVVCVQNFYNIATGRTRGAGGDGFARHRLRAVLPLAASRRCSRRAGVGCQALGATPIAVAESWLLQRSPNVMLIPGTSSVDHLREKHRRRGPGPAARRRRELDAI